MEKALQVHDMSHSMLLWYALFFKIGQQRCHMAGLLILMHGVPPVDSVYDLYLYILYIHKNTLFNTKTPPYPQ